MVERRCRATLLVQTESASGPLPARNEVNPRAELAQASWSFFSKDQVQSDKTVFDTINLRKGEYVYSSFGHFINASKMIYLYTSRENSYYDMYFYRKRIHVSSLGIFNRKDPLRDWPEYYSSSNNPIRFNEPSGLIMMGDRNINDSCYNPEYDWISEIASSCDLACSKGVAHLRSHGLRPIANCISEQCLKERPQIRCIRTSANKNCEENTRAYVDHGEAPKRLPINLSIFGFRELNRCEQTNAMIREIFHRCEIKTGSTGDSDKVNTSNKIGHIEAKNQYPIWYR